MVPAVFLDKDGTLIPDIPYNVDPDLITLSFGAEEALRSLHQSGFKLIIVSNQSGVARGFFSETELSFVEQKIRELLDAIDVPLTGFYYCPHHLSGKIAKYAIACNCRKPSPGMLVKAAQKHSIDLQRSWMIGDILNDIEAGHRAGCKTILIDNGNETEWVLSPQRVPHYKVTDLIEAANQILQ
ncbi:D-glycero-alpha-D-manno-heptose-1,7-bisphosphate 7-phosphatase [Phormidesmis sp. 146-35]